MVLLVLRKSSRDSIVGGLCVPCISMGEATMSDPRIEKWADVLTGYCVDVQPGQTVAISGGVSAEPLLRAIYAKVVERGGYPVLSPDFSGLSAALIGNGNDDQLG